MPELPDLEVFSRNLQKSLSGKKLKKIAVINKSKIKSSEKEFRKALETRQLENVYREGKELRFKFSDNKVLGLHLMRNGRIYLFDNKNDHKYTIIELLFADNTGLALTDFQGMAVASLNPVEKNSPDALSAEINFKFLKDRLSKTRTTIKNLLLDQKMIRGIGNAYADEILWDALISPLSVSNKIPDEKIKALAKSVKKVLANAIRQIRKEHPDIINGEIKDFLQIHNAKKKQSPRGGIIRHQTIGGRKTYYTDEQEVFR